MTKPTAALMKTLALCQLRMLEEVHQGMADDAQRRAAKEQRWADAARKEMRRRGRVAKACQPKS